MTQCVRRIAATTEPHDAPSQMDGSGTLVDVATWNICSGRNGGLESALQAMKVMALDICILTEVKLTASIYAKVSSGYSTVTTNAASKLQGGFVMLV